MDRNPSELMAGQHFQTGPNLVLAAKSTQRHESVRWILFFLFVLFVLFVAVIR
jgi:hypothetical protein